MALFSPFRALGYITDSVPFAVQRRGTATFVTVSVGKAWQVYNTEKLRLVLVGPQLTHAIGALAAKGDLTFAACRGTIVECKRVHRSGEYRGGHSGDILQLLVLGDRLLSLGDDRKLLVWRIGQYEAPEVSIQLPEGFTPTCLAHPDTYLNKIVVGSEEGRLQLWNFATAQMLFEFPGFGSAVRCIQTSPALDVVGLGLEDGRAVVHNLRYNETLMSFHNASGVGTNADRFLTGSDAQAAAMAAAGACTSIAFRTGQGVPLMAAGGGAGVVTVWNLEARRLHTLIRDAHDSPLVCLHFFPGEPLLMTSGRDNAVKQWVFDATDGAARLLKFRSGHAAPPTIVRHYGSGRLLLSAGQDRAFRAFSTIQDAQSRELSQHHTARRAKRLRIEEAELKLSPVLALDTCDVRERDWSNVLTSHADDTRAYVWRLQKYALGEWVLFPPPKQLAGAEQAQVTSVCLSRCGNFGFVGSESGRVDRYNMQSGLHRGSYCRNQKLMQQAILKSAPGVAAPKALLEDPGVTAHDGPVRGVCTDSCNRLVATAGADGFVRVWDFKKRTLQAEIRVGAAVARVCHHPGTGLMAAACEDNVIRMFDLEAARLVRQFKGHTAAVSDMQISDDCRWLVSASLDGTVRCWDIPGARVLQVMRLGAPVTSLSLGPAQDLLATSHVGKRGIYLWANQMLFGSGADIVPSDSPIRVRLPTISSAGGGSGPAAGSADGASGATAQQRAELRLMLRQTQGGGSGGGDSPESEEEEEGEEAQQQAQQQAEPGSDEEEEEGEEEAAAAAGGVGKQRQQGASAEAPAELDPAKAAAAAAAYAARDASGAPAPLAPELVTLSMLPRTQVQNLVHLDTIKARNKPIEPPKKLASAPFFLPTLAGADAGRNPVFDFSSPPAGGESGGAADEALAAKAAAAWGDGEEEEGEEERPQDGAADAAGSEKQRQRPQLGRVLKTRAQVEHSQLVRLLHSCAHAGDWTSLVAHLRSLPPVAVDAEIRSMQVLEGAPEQELEELALLLSFLEEETGSNRNFEFVQALLRVVLQVHGDVIAEHAELAECAQRTQQRLAATWRRLDGLMQSVRCMVGFLGNLQA